MLALREDMTHDQASDWLRMFFKILGWYEIEPLLEQPNPFGAIRSIMCNLDLVAALYYGWDRKERRQIATKWKTVMFLGEIFPKATGNQDYERFAEHLYEMFRVGTVHLGMPKRVRNDACSPPELTWILLTRGMTTIENSGGQTFLVTHLKLIPRDSQTKALVVCPAELYADFKKGCEYFANLVQAEKGAGHERLDRWRQTADALSGPEVTNDLTW